MKTFEEIINEHQNTVIELVNEIIDSCRGKKISDASLAYRIAGLCRRLEVLPDDVPDLRGSVIATDLFGYSYLHAMANGLVKSIGWWDIIAGGIADYYLENGEIDDNEKSWFLKSTGAISEGCHRLIEASRN